MPEKVNMVDIARRAGVSLATASRALSSAPGVAPATRERVLAVAEQLSYVVSPWYEAYWLTSAWMAGLMSLACGRLARSASTPRATKMDVVRL